MLATLLLLCPGMHVCRRDYLLIEVLHQLLWLLLSLRKWSYDEATTPVFGRLQWLLHH